MRDKISDIFNRIKNDKPYFVRGGRLRSGWRVALYIVAAFIALIVFGLAFGFAVAGLWMSRGLSFADVRSLFTDFSTRPFNYPDVAIPYIIGRALVPLGVIWLFRKFIDKRPFLDLGFHRPPGWLRELGIGFAISIGAWLVIFLLALVFGAAQVTNFSWNLRGILPAIGLLVLGLFFNLLVGVAEESDARGYILQNLKEGVGLQRAIAVSSIYFAALHLANPGGLSVGTLIGIVCAGVLLAMGYVITRRMWFPIGMHAAWNFAEGSLFGFRVSGLNLDGLLDLNITGADWLMGGAFGPEAGLLAIFVQIVMIALMIGWHQDRLESAQRYIKSLPAIIAERIRSAQTPAPTAAPSAEPDRLASAQTQTATKTSKELTELAPAQTREATPTSGEPTRPAPTLGAPPVSPKATQPVSKPIKETQPARPTEIPQPTQTTKPSPTRKTPAQALQPKPVRKTSTPPPPRSEPASPKSIPGQSSGETKSRGLVGSIKEFLEVFFAGWGEPPFRR